VTFDAVFPQQATELLASKAHPPFWPSERAVMPVRSSTGTGDDATSLLTPSPSWPTWLDPQHLAVVSASSAQVDQLCIPGLLEIAVTPVKPAT